MSTTTVRMDDDLKAEVNAILDSMGLNFNTFVNMASVQLVSQRRIPFEVKAPEPVLPRAGHVAANGVTYRGVDETYADRFLHLLQRIEARVTTQDRKSVV